MSERPEPGHTIWAVEKNGDQSFWGPIGAAWQHGDGDGMSLRFKFWPTAGPDIVIRKIKPKVEDQIFNEPADTNGFRRKVDLDKIFYAQHSRRRAVSPRPSKKQRQVSRADQSP
jgi:hypothetical protein